MQCTTCVVCPCILPRFKIWLIEGRAKRCLEISCLEEIDVETVSFADIIVIKNGLRKEEESFARSCSISFSEVCFCTSAFPRDLGLHNKGRRVSLADAVLMIKGWYVGQFISLPPVHSKSCNYSRCRPRVRQRVFQLNFRRCNKSGLSSSLEQKLLALHRPPGEPGSTAGLTSLGCYSSWVGGPS